MNNITKLLAVLLISCMGLPQFVNATSWSPLPKEREEKAATGIVEKGAIICLFQSGTPDVKKAISAGDNLSVYRESDPRELKEVGKIKVLSYSGEIYLKAVVVEGELRAGDIAKKGDVSALVLLSEDKCK